MGGIGSHTKPNGGYDEWITPPEIVSGLGPFDLDPCAAVGQPFQTAGLQYTIEDNGLDRPWTGCVWMNPPYGKSTGLWLSRLADHGDGIALIFARTETRMFFDYVWPRATSLLFIEGRLHFHYVDGSRAKCNSGGPSVLIAYGERAADRLANSSIPGKLVVLRGSNEP